MLLRHVGSLVEVVGQVVLGVDGVHRSSGQNVRGTDKHRVRDTVAELLSLLNAGELLPCGLIDADAVKHSKGR